MKQPGNRERIENLKWARDHCDGLFAVVLLSAVDVNAEPREVAEAYPTKLTMRLIELNAKTGEFSAEVVDGMPKGPKGDKRPGDGNSN